jgi:hypothetical protein
MSDNEAKPDGDSKPADGAEPITIRVRDQVRIELSWIATSATWRRREGAARVWSDASRSEMMCFANLAMSPLARFQGISSLQREWVWEEIEELVRTGYRSMDDAFHFDTQRVMCHSSFVLTIYSHTLRK